ncbi:MAG: hypothetical protein A2020_09960 [Lentisphaerae bacterium GWF2_45_14]|nr:MAG: hypothetical protein A2020_09960 [Lentisphaerae bacterium GWF2_45_14]
MAYLVVRDKELTYNVKLDESKEFTMGRSPANELHFDGNITVSNKHCIIVYNEEKSIFVLRDLKSLNGTILNLNRISADIALADNDKIKIGDIRILFKDGSTSNPSTKTRKVLRLAKSRLPSELDATATCVIPNLTNIKRKPTVKVFDRILLRQGDIVGSYRIMRKIGDSRYGSVYMCTIGDKSKFMALKIYNQAFDIHHSGIDEFYNILGKIIQIKSPYFLNIFDTGVHKGHCYYVMDYVPEGDLNDIIAKSAPFRESDAVCIVYTIADALREVYDSMKIVHGELSPDNILVDADSNILIRGCGISHWMKNYISESYTKGIMPWYVSPEQIEGQDPDWYSDLYSLGIIFFQLLTGHIPFPGDNKEVVYNLHLNKELPNPRSLNPNIAITDDTLSILSRMTKKSPRRRFSCWNELLQAMEAAVEKASDAEEFNFINEPVTPPRRENIDKSHAKTFGSFFGTDEQKGDGHEGTPSKEEI